MNPIYIPSYNNIGERVVMKSKGPPQRQFEVPMHLVVPDDSYVEVYAFRDRSLPGRQTTHPVWVVWQPDGQIICKPGCVDQETLGATIRRLERILKRIDKGPWRSVRVRQCQFTRARTEKWLEILRNCAQYEWTA